MIYIKQVKVKYVGLAYWGLFGDKVYTATPRHIRERDKKPVKWQIQDKDGDNFIITNGSIEEGLRKGWELVKFDYNRR